MESESSGRILRTRSEQLGEMDGGVKQLSLSRTASAEMINGSGQHINYNKSSFRKKLANISPGKSRSSGAGNHIRKSRSAQLNYKLDLEDVSSGTALSRASSASLGMSFSFTGFTPPPQDILAHLDNFSDDDSTYAGDRASHEADDARRNRMIIEPTLPLYLKFTEVKYKVIIKGVTSTRDKEILRDITGSAGPGEVLALMGPSGSGKTTLLSLLGGRISGNITEGIITYNDEPYSKSLKSRIGFVTQDDVLFAHLTVKETLTYAALLRLPKTMTKQQKKDRAMDVIYELGLERCQDTMIGGSFVRGVSGGERKRVCIGNEILTNPSLLFLDEPTSGLDSTTALRIVQILHDIAAAGKTVVTTIHQPSSRIFHKFDKLILLAKGSLLYYGKASEAMVYFSSIGCNPLISMNPAEFLLDLANSNMIDVSIPSELKDRVHMENLKSDPRSIDRLSSKDIHEYLVEAYETRVASKEKKKLLLPIPINEDVKARVSSPMREWGASWWQQYTILFWRGLKERRYDHLSWMRITQVIATAAILGLLWWHSDSSTPKGLQDQVGLLFFISVFWGFFPVFTAIFTFPQERAMLSKERCVDMYRLSAYFMARTTSDLPLDLILPILFMLIVYFMAGLKLSPGPFFLSLVIVFLDIIAAEGVGLVIGASLMDIKKATTLASVTVMTFMLSGGFFVKRVPVFISWMRYISFNYHTYRLLLKVQYGHVPAYVNVIDQGHGVREVVAMIAMIFGYRLLAYLSLRRMKLQAAA
ncbi:Xenobiotic-transporting ATPase protein [Dioscorea alata]|uniref:Xenobiotic-transporting ATPase protein n=1 Tax=Dioscorea alata TaxID=55571 RepID=A0ACB7UZN9_DIOAL|nr:Xenobiotic-transporting ATPase protein [Dioscorea alata]